jgi:hypothetical protein
MGKANPHRGEVGLSLGGRKYKLVPSYANLSAVEEACGMGLLELAQKLTSGGYRLAYLAEILAAVAEPEISVEGAGEAIASGGVANVVEPVARFLTQALLGGEAGNAPAATGK